MAKLMLDKNTCAFLDIVLTDTEAGVGARICLRVPAALGHSPLVVYEEIVFSDALDGARRFIDDIFDDKTELDASLGLKTTCSHDGLTVSLKRKNAEIVYSASAEPAAVARFKSSLLKSLRLLGHDTEPPSK